MTKPIAFMVMPFAVKPTGLTGPMIPSEVDFDALWERVYEQVLAKLGYIAVRADRDLGALIINDMIQRLAVADLVVADVSLPNANVYYEVGVRHAARPAGCVLVAADWSHQPFDTAQMRQLRFPLPDGKVPEDVGAAARDQLSASIASLVDGRSPVFDAVPGFPDRVELDRLPTFRAFFQELSAFDREVREVSLAPSNLRRQKALAIVRSYGHASAVRESVVLQLIRLLRDHADWQDVLEYIDTLPTALQEHPLIVEQRCLAVAKDGDPAAGAAALEQLIKNHGETTERWGLLGGRFKQLHTNATTDSARRRFLNEAIRAYERGMLLDLNDYYSSSNLPRLYRRRNSPGDRARADAVAVITTEACRRRLSLGIDDGWARASLLGMAFFRGDVESAESLRDEVEHMGSAAWQLWSTLNDLHVDVTHHDDPAIRTGLTAVLRDLEALLAEESSLRAERAEDEADV